MQVIYFQYRMLFYIFPVCGMCTFSRALSVPCLWGRAELISWAFSILGRFPWHELCERESVLLSPFHANVIFHQILKIPTSKNCLPFPAEKWQIWVKLKSRCPINWGMGISENNPRKLLLFSNSCSKRLKLLRLFWV